MGIRYSANTARCFGKAYIDSRGILQVRSYRGDYALLEKVDFGNGRRGLQISHYGASCGTGTVEVRLDSPEGRCIGVVPCSKMAFDNMAVAWGAIEETKGIHDVYLHFFREAGYREFRFTIDSPYDKCDYTSVPDENLIDVQADTWEATDMLGRRLPSPEECPERRNKQVGLFYWTWHENSAGEKDAQNIIDVIRDYPEAEYDINHPVWGIFKNHWNKPLFGHYRDTDPYVIRKHMIMFANAGVDFIAFDTTNAANIMCEAYTTLFEQMRRAKLDGINVPKFTFLMPFRPCWETLFMIRYLYQDIYKPGLYEDLWYKLDGKPLMLAYPESIPEEGTGEFDTALLKEMKEFFTFRPCQPSYAHGPLRDDHWGWLESAPQHKFRERPDGSCEQMTVGVAQNRTDDSIGTRFNIEGSYGRSYTSKTKQALLSMDSYKYGYNFQEQWDNALAADPDIVFITGWNEWTAGRWPGPSRWIPEEGSTQLAFVDQYDREHSRDIEPDCDGYLDTYYLQLCANIRKFKGTSKMESAGGEIDGKADWSKVAPTYRNHKRSTLYRDYPGFGKTLRFSNRTSRNDIVEAKVARSSENLYFYAKCVDDIVAEDNENCMNLLINSDRDAKTGWEGYNYRISGVTIYRFVCSYKNGGFNWEACGNVTREINGNEIVYKVKKSDIGIEKLDFEFKWIDNCFPEGKSEAPSVMDFYVNGVSAPFGRFNYRYKV